jgi:hypothetical protein
MTWHRASGLGRGGDSREGRQRGGIAGAGQRVVELAGLPHGERLSRLQAVEAEQRSADREARGAVGGPVAEVLEPVHDRAHLAGCRRERTLPLPEFL